ncbi:flagellar biosynthetic protein FliR [Bacillus thermotolerans]|uniref:flagellar biosynthetic protein FliR n=1 Tax=Bacillus thermotolerans TaxID=1221996 RepID=UPI00057F0486|nr:flagellar biosynthetic protein FliR [Bacillus thermotolerans]KKB38962.1 Flagellar biosynthesis protein FliR [Bacillus thermotolerans]KKB44681.1 Flagellar biosynthesis protein FliR [Bacillus thermotolerans]
MEEIIPELSVLLLVIVRVTSFFIVIPLFSHRTIPAMHRIGFAILLSWMMYYTVEVPMLEIDGRYVLLVLKEALVGLSIGLAAYIILAAIQIAGALIDFQMGFIIANVIDPQTGAQTPLTGQYLNMFALLLLLALDGHHLILDGIYYSYQYIPVDQIALHFGDGSLANYISRAFGMMFMLALQMAMPVVAVLFLVDVALGIVARTVPQINIFVVGFPIKIAVAFIVMVVVMGAIFAVVEELFEMMLYTMRDVMTLLGGT